MTLSPRATFSTLLGTTSLLGLRKVAQALMVMLQFFLLLDKTSPSSGALFGRKS